MQESSDESPTSFAVGDVVRLSADPDEVRTSFDSVRYCWDDMMIPMCGQTFTVLEDPENCGLPPGVIGLASPDGSQNNTWYFPTAVVEKLQTRKEHALLMKYSMSIGKAMAGAVRFVLEDLTQGACQVIFLIKKWHFTTWHSKAFTLASIFTGVTLSLFVPLKEYLSMKGTERKVKAARPELAKDLKLDQKNGGQPGAGTGQLSEAWRDDDPMKTTIERDMYIAEYLQGRGYTQQHAGACHKALVASSTMFWMSVLVLSFVARPLCGGDQHWLRYATFMLVTGVDLAVQAWVLLHSKLGYHLVVFQPLKLVSGAALTILGHFDSFADSSFTGMLQNCEAITNFTIKERYFHPSYWHAGQDFDGDRVFLLPFELGHISLIALFVGVFVCQALPGLIMLFRKKWLPLTFKMNELNLLLVLMDEEAVYMNEDGQDERSWFESLGAGATAAAGFRILRE